MLKILRGLGWTLAGLLLLTIVVWCASRMWPVPESRLQAQQRLEARLPASGRNGYALLWTLPFDDLDARQREQALAEDVRRWEADLRGSSGGQTHLVANHAELRSRLNWPGGQMRPRPVHLNTWEGFYFDVYPDKIGLKAWAGTYEYGMFSPYGLGGGYYYSRVSLAF